LAVEPRGGRFVEARHRRAALQKSGDQKNLFDLTGLKIDLGHLARRRDEASQPDGRRRTKRADGAAARALMGSDNRLDFALQESVHADGPRDFF